ncbi:unnamed protein product [Tuber aestivum]|uniref:Uncharacterized protein n=1 Tax=Tuber aestivum TaxID=59557 RepID=A0A292Q4M0_9PEZI|nr:unnamed protein product [Tuber aestivum]
MMIAFRAWTMHHHMSSLARSLSLNQNTRQYASRQLFKKQHGLPRPCTQPRTDSYHARHGNESVIKLPKLSSILGSLRTSFPHLREWISNKEKVKRLVGWGGAGGATILTIMEVIYTYHCNKARERELESALAKGAVPDVFVESFVERTGISKEIALVLQPRAGYHS